MALYRYFKTADSVLPAPTGSLSTSISPAAIKDANEAVKSAVTPRSKSRGAYAKHTPEQQAAIGKYASMRGNKAAVRHLTRVERRYIDLVLTGCRGVVNYSCRRENKNCENKN